MMRASTNEDTQLTIFPAEKQAGKVCEAVSTCARAALIVLVLIITPAARAGANFDLVSAAGGITLTQVGNNYISSFGTMNALNIGTPAAGVTAIPLSNGTLYYTPYSLFVHGGLAAGQTGYVTAYVSTNFGNPAALILQSCPSSSSCNTAAQFSTMSTNAGAQTTVIAPPGIARGVTVNAGLAIFVPDNNGANAFNGTDSAVISFTMINNNTGGLIETLQLSLNNPRETLQNAVQLTLATAPGGLTVNPAADYSMNFGNVNGLGIGPGAGLTVTSAAGGVIYSTPYLLRPAFSDQSATTGTIQVNVTTRFVHPTILQLEDAAVPAGPFTVIAGGGITITTTAANRSSITRYLGLFVSNANGAGSFRGTDTATVTFQLTVP
jgi:hypothetical protein